MKSLILKDWEAKGFQDDRIKQIRRVMKVQPSQSWAPYSFGEVHRKVNGEPDPEQVVGWGPCNAEGDEAYVSPYRAGDILVCKETWDEETEDPNDGCPHTYRWIHYRATPHIGFRVQPTRAACTYWHESKPFDEAVKARRWRSPVTMPKEYSRLSLQITEVRVERMERMSPADALLCGVKKVRESCYVWPGFGYDLSGLCHSCPTTPYSQIWDSTAKRGELFEDNRWMWVYGVRRVAA